MNLIANSTTKKKINRLCIYIIDMAILVDNVVSNNRMLQYTEAIVNL